MRIFSPKDVQSLRREIRALRIMRYHGRNVRDPVHVGTTGSSKGVMLSHRNLTAAADAACRATRFDRNSRFVSVLPIHHTYELTCAHLAHGKSRLHFVYQRKPPLCNEKLQGIQAEFAHTRSPFPRNHSQKDLGRDPQKENGEESGAAQWLSR